MKKILLLIIAVGFSSTLFAQLSGKDLRGPQCTTCTDPKDYINDNGDNTFTADSAQAYFWQICSGQGTIVGSNTGQTVEVQGTPGNNFSIKVVRFALGKCIEACETGTVQMSCDFDPDLGGKLFCDGPGQGGNGNVKLAMDPSELQDISQITYYYDISNNYPGFEFSNGSTIMTATGTPNNGFNVNFSFDSNCQTISTFVIDLYIEYNNGCPDEWYDNIEVTLSSYSPIIIFPNPGRGNDTINFDGVDYKNIDKLEIRNIHGRLVKSIKPNGQTFETNGLQKGIYLVNFVTHNRGEIQKKLVIQ